jgi:hypothetical protein
MVLFPVDYSVTVPSMRDTWAGMSQTGYRTTRGFCLLIVDAEAKGVMRAPLIICFLTQVQPSSVMKSGLFFI